MRTSKRTIAMITIVAGLIAGSGCAGRAISEGVGQVRGVRGIFFPLDEVYVNLSTYERFELGEVEDDFGGQVPDDFWTAFREGFPMELADRNIPSAESGKTLIARGRVFHIETNDLSGLVLGDFEEVIARIELVDAASGRVIGVANCIGRSNASVNRGVRDKGRGLARAIGAFIDDAYPDQAKPPKPDSDETERQTPQ